ncbi:hypothetical protein [Colwellia sp. UCD-KL20]|uniref:hypothetical protein n=1 Tax=Colwellia sp. UCD-KL20 TaxID=1917165 RepID=UPI00097116E6|nr:hypothetical protein [Colwellia sp. UCD-KL20]
MKNWTVISKPIKEQARGLANYLNYLINTEHKNHKNKTKIIPVFGVADKLYQRIIYSVAERDLERSKKRKGGRAISSYAQSYVFTLPENLPKHPSYSDWKNISVELLKTIQAFTGVSPDELKKNIFINIHDQKNPHLNIVVSKIMDKSVKTELQKKSIVTALKKTFNFAVMQTIKLSPENYKPLKKRSKRYDEYQYQQKKLTDSCDDFLLKKLASPLTKNNIQQNVKGEI